MSADLGAVEEFPEGQVSPVWVGGTEIGIVRWNGTVYAIGAVCTHQGGPLCRGVVSGRLGASQPGALSMEDAAPVIACPWHGWEFDLGTGAALWDPSRRVRTYPVEIIAGRVRLRTGKGREG